MLTEDTVAYYATIAIFMLYLGVVVYVLKPRAKLINLSDLNLRLLTAWTLIVATLLASFIVGVVGVLKLANLLSVSAYGSPAKYIVNLLATGIYLFPLPIAIITYFTTPNLLRKRLKLRACPDPEIIAQIGECARKVCLRSPPKALECPTPGSPPFTFGLTTARSMIVIPKNFGRILEMVSKSSSQRVDDVRRFVLLHEVAHIKNGDVPLMTWGSVFGGYLAAWAVISLLILVAGAVLGSEFPLTLVLIWIGAGASYISLISLSRRRESLADALASVYLNEEQLLNLAGTSENVLPQFSWLEAFAVAASFSLPIGNSLGFTVRQHRLSFSPEPIRTRVQRFRELVATAFLKTHPMPKERLHQIQTRAYIGENMPLPDAASYFLSGVNAVVLWISAAIIVRGGNLLAGYLRNGASVDSLSSTPLTVSTGLFLFVPVAFFAIPISYLGISPSQWSHGRIIKTIVSRIGAAILPVTLGLLLLFPLDHSRDTGTKIGAVLGMAILLFVLSACMTLFGFAGGLMTRTVKYSSFWKSTWGTGVGILFGSAVFTGIQFGLRFVLHRTLEFHDWLFAWALSWLVGFVVASSMKVSIKRWAVFWSTFHELAFKTLPQRGVLPAMARVLPWGVATTIAYVPIAYLVQFVMNGYRENPESPMTLAAVGSATIVVIALTIVLLSKGHRP